MENITRFSASIRKVFSLAADAAQELGHPAIEDYHLLVAMSFEKDGVARHVLSRLGITPAYLVTLINNSFPKHANQQQQSTLAPSAKHLIKRSIEEARRLHTPYVGTGHLLRAAVYENGPTIRVVLAFVHAQPQDVNSLVRQLVSQNSHPKDRVVPAPPSIDRALNSLWGLFAKAVSPIAKEPKLTTSPQTTPQNKKGQPVLYLQNDLAAFYPVTPQSLVTWGNIHLWKNELDEALTCFEEALRSKPDEAEAYYGRGVVKQTRKRYLAAAADFTDAIRLNAGNVNAYFHRASVYQAQREYEKAIADCNTALRLSPACADAYTVRGGVYHAQKEYALALKDFDELIRLKPDSAFGYASRSLEHYCLKHYDQAAADATEAIRLSSKYVLAYIHRANAYMHLYNYPAALMDLNQALRLEPKHVNARLARARAYFGENELDRAIEDCNQVLKLDPWNCYAYHIRGTALADKQDYNGAEADFKRRLRLCPNDSYSHSNFGWLSLLRLDYDGAVRFCDAALQIDAKNGAAYYSRGTARAAKGDHEGAISDYHQALEYWPLIHSKHSEPYMRKMKIYLDRWDRK